MVYIDTVSGRPESNVSLVSTYLKKERRGFICDHYVMVLLVKGYGKYIEEDTGVEHSLTEGCIYQRFPRRSHAQVLDTDNNEQFFIRVPKEIFQLLDDRGLINRNPVLEMKEDVMRYFQDCYLDCIRENSGIYALWRIKDLIVKLHEISRQESTPSVMDEVVKFLEKNLHKRIPLAEIAAKFNMSYISFRRSFKTYLGVSPGAWMIQRRVEKAIEMLTIETLSVEEISHYLGYPDIYTFSKQFKKEKGLPPSEFRQQLLKSRIESHT